MFTIYSHIIMNCRIRHINSLMVRRTGYSDMKNLNCKTENHIIDCCMHFLCVNFSRAAWLAMTSSNVDWNWTGSWMGLVTTYAFKSQSGCQFLIKKRHNMFYDTEYLSLICAHRPVHRPVSGHSAGHFRLC